ncbi:NCS1 family nucleobase:cation symporter-1 [Streptacidiphilus sp. MAP12-16]|uniref:purine-cytosine permease family protein n=1 Tax=Streptacidiphilus sp. MAP12-16 TaxID=3156300 RepID=UPI00351637A2
MTQSSDAPARPTALDAPSESQSAYGSKVLAVEAAGSEAIPAAERHGRPLHLLWTWTSPNMEFATVFIGVLAVSAFGLSFWQAMAALLLGTGLASLCLGLLSQDGPLHGLPQMALSRLAFGRLGNCVPAAVNTLTAGLGWFAVNSVSAALALNTLLGLPKIPSLLAVAALQILAGFLGHNLIHRFERFAMPVLVVVFLTATVATLGKAHLGAPSHGGGSGGFLLTAGAAFGYAGGWTPFASDYTRYLPSTAPRWQTGLWPAVGNFGSNAVLLAAGAASATIATDPNASPTAAFTGLLPSPLADLTLLAIILGGVCANALNIYSAAVSFTTLGIRLPVRSTRAWAVIVFGVLGTAVALTGLKDSGSRYENFLLIISYWVGPWIAVYLTERFLTRREDIGTRLTDPRFTNWSGLLSFLLGAAVSVWLFSNQSYYTGPIAKAHPAIGDITSAVGFALAALCHITLRRIPALAPSTAQTHQDDH